MTEDRGTVGTARTDRVEAPGPRRDTDGRDTDDLDTLGVEAADVQHDSAGRNLLVGVIGLVLVIGALIPLTIGALWVGSLVYAGIVAFFTGSPEPGL
jgi:hypothetical protein